MHRKSCITTALAVWLVAFLQTPVTAVDNYKMISPDGRIEIVIEMPMTASTEQPRWSAAFQGKPILGAWELGLETADAGEVTAGVKVEHARTRSVNQRIPVLFGRADHADNSFHETRFSLETPQRRRFDVVFRAYNDAVA